MFGIHIMYIYNITFAVEASRLEKLLDWIRTYASAGLTRDGATSPRLTMIEGSPEEETEIKSVALQLEFASLAEFGKWESSAFAPVMQKYSVDFAPEPLFFATLLRELPIR